MTDDDPWKPIRDHNAFVAGLQGRPNPYGTSHFYHHENGKHLRRQAHNKVHAKVGVTGQDLRNEELKLDFEKAKRAGKSVGIVLFKTLALVVSISIGVVVVLGAIIALNVFVTQL
jgi:hypothetical protein